MKAVVWTDSFQMLVMFAGMLALLISGSLKLGGLDVAWDIANKNQRILFFESVHLALFLFSTNSVFLVFLYMRRNGGGGVAITIPITFFCQDR